MTAMGDGLPVLERIRCTLIALRMPRALEVLDHTVHQLDRRRILALAELQFVNRREVVHFLGPPGTGKSHLAVALGVEAVKAGRSVYFTTLEHDCRRLNR